MTDSFAELWTDKANTLLSIVHPKKAICGYGLPKWTSRPSSARRGSKVNRISFVLTEETKLVDETFEVLFDSLMET